MVTIGYHGVRRRKMHFVLCKRLQCVLENMRNYGQGNRGVETKTRKGQSEVSEC